MEWFLCYATIGGAFPWNTDLKKKVKKQNFIKYFKLTEKKKKSLTTVVSPHSNLTNAIFYVFAADFCFSEMKYYKSR